MRNVKGIQCKSNEYDVTAIAVVDGKPTQLNFKTNARDTKYAKKFAAEKLNVKPSQVLINYELHKKCFTINCDLDTLYNALGAANISIEMSDDSYDTQE